MAQHLGSPEWITAYLEWTNTEFSVASGMDADVATDIATAYLEWIDASPAKERRAPAFRAGEPQREAVLLLALRTESACMQIVRQALDARISCDIESGMDWPSALASVEADMRALSGRILELRAH
jgi:hypothetical protein